MKPWLTVFALSTMFVLDASAGALHARIEGPATNGFTYTVNTSGCDATTSLEPWALAEGVVDGKRQSRLIRLEATSRPGQYRFQRTWPKEGRWMIRFMLGNPSAPATVAELRGDGTIRSNRLYSRTDGFKECQRALRKWQTVVPGEDDC